MCVCGWWYLEVTCTDSRVGRAAVSTQSDNRQLIIYVNITQTQTNRQTDRPAAAAAAWVALQGRAADADD